MSKSLIIFCSLIALSFSYSGVKFLADTELVKAFGKIDYNKVLQNRTLLRHYEFEGKVLLMTYKLIIDNFYIANVTGPQSVEIIQDKTPEGLKRVGVSLKNFGIILSIDFDFKYSLIHESAKNTKLGLIIESVDYNYYFKDNGEIDVGDIKVAAGDLYIDSTSSMLKTIIKLLNPTVKELIAASFKGLNLIISSFLNELVKRDPFLVDFKLGFGINGTLTDKPSLIESQETLKKEINIDNFYDLLTKTFINKEGEYEIKDPSTNQVKRFVSFGISGLTYLTKSPETQPDLPPAVDMKFNEKYFDNEFQLLMSDRAINGFFFLLQQMNLLQWSFRGPFSFFYPFEFNIEGISKYFPEFARKYPGKNYEITMTVSHKKINRQAIIETSENSTQFSINFLLDFYTKTSEDPEVEKVNDLKANITFSNKIMVHTENDKINIDCGKIIIDKIDLLMDQISVDVQNIRRFTTYSVDQLILEKLNQILKNIDILSILNKFSWGLTYHHLKIDQLEKYFGMTFGIQDI